MTLLLGIATPWGMWLSSDHRLTRLPGGQLITDTSVKHVGIKTHDGMALVAYTGLGRVASEDVSDWLRKSLRGEQRSLEASVQQIADRATDGFGDQVLAAGIVHVFVVAAYLQGDAYVVAVANTDTPFGVANPPLRRDFKVHPVRITGPVTVFAGGGVFAVTEADRKLLDRLKGVRPNKPEDFLGLLAAVNRRAASSGGPGHTTISSGCVVGQLVQGDATVRTQHFGDEGASSEVESAPFILDGIDTTEIMRAMPRYDPTTGEFVGGSDYEEALRRSVRPENR